MCQCCVVLVGVCLYVGFMEVCVWNAAKESSEENEDEATALVSAFCKFWW